MSIYSFRKFVIPSVETICPVILFFDTIDYYHYCLKFKFFLKEEELRKIRDDETRKIHEGTEFLEEITEQEIVIDINEGGTNMEYTTPKVIN